MPAKLWESLPPWVKLAITLVGGCAWFAWQARGITDRLTTLETTTDHLQKQVESLQNYIYEHDGHAYLAPPVYAAPSDQQDAGAPPPVNEQAHHGR